MAERSLTRSLMLTNSYLEFPLKHCLANILFRCLFTGHWINNLGGVPNMFLSYLLWSLKDCEDKGTNFWTQKLWLFTVERHCLFVAVDKGAINIMNGISTYFPFVNYKLGGCTRSTRQQYLEYHLSRFVLGDGVLHRNQHALCIFEFLKTPCWRMRQQLDMPYDQNPPSHRTGLKPFYLNTRTLFSGFWPQIGF